MTHPRHSPVKKSTGKFGALQVGKVLSSVHTKKDFEKVYCLYVRKCSLSAYFLLGRRSERLGRRLVCTCIRKLSDLFDLKFVNLINILEKHFHSKTFS